MNPTRPARRAGVALAASVAAVLPAVPAAADTIVTDTIHDAQQTFVDQLPSCSGGPLYEVTATFQFVEHRDENGSGVVVDGHLVQQYILLNAGTFTATPVDGTGPDARGRFTAYTQVNLNDSTVVGTTSLTISYTTADGRSVTFHTVDHVTTMPNGSVDELFHCQDHSLGLPPP